MGQYNLAKLLQSRAAQSCKSSFIITINGEQDVEETSFAVFQSQVIEWAKFLKAQGVEKGDRVAFLTVKSALQHRMFYACWWLGAIAVPICETLGDIEMAFVIKDSDSKVVFTQDSLKDKVARCSVGLPLFILEEMPLTKEVNEIDLEVLEIEDDEIATLIYTSGSTGMPKGVMLTHKNLYRNAESACEHISLEENDRVISLLPYWHSYALVVEVILIVYKGLSVAVPSSQKDFKMNIGKYQPTVMIVVPRIASVIKSGIEKNIETRGGKVKELFDQAIYNASRIFTAGPGFDGGLLRIATHHAFYDPLIFRKIRGQFGGKLRFIISGGAPIDMEHQIFFKYLGIPIYQGYGLTETTPVISTNSDDFHRIGSCGLVLNWLKPENGGDYILQDEDGNRSLDIEGELLVKGDCVMKGYWGHTDETVKTITEDGWLCTGDVARIDSDGYLFIEGRKGSMIVLRGGEKLHPEHIEDVIKSSDLISEVMIFGEKCKNVYAFVNVDAEKVKDLPAEEIEKKVRAQVMEKVKHLAPYQRPKDVLILPEFNQENGCITPTLKIRRYKIKENYENQIAEFLNNNGEDFAVRAKDDVSVHASKVLESLKK